MEKFSDLLPTDPLLLQKRVAELEAENGSLRASLVNNEDLTNNQGREIQRLMGQLVIWKRTAALQAGLDLAVITEEADSNSQAVVDEFDLNLARGALRVIRTLHASIIQLRRSNGTGLKDFVEAKISQIHAEEGTRQAEEDATVARAERDQMQAERDRAIEIANNTSHLRAIYEESIIRSREEVEKARASEQSAWAKTEELGGVHARNQDFREANQRLIEAKATDDARIADLESQVAALIQQVETVRDEKQAPVDISQNPGYQELMAVKDGLIGEIAERNRVIATKDRRINELEQAIKNLERENQRLGTALASTRDNLAKATGKKGGGGFLSHIIGR